jgi:arginyl-tRNA synthetase
MNLLQEVRELFKPVLTKLVGNPAEESELLSAVIKGTRPELADYQANFSVRLAKLLNRPTEAAAVAQEVINDLPTNELVDTATVVAQGSQAFINIKLKSDFLAQRVQQIATDTRLGVNAVSTPKRFVIDYSGPNVAKPLHVGHLRSTIIGDSLIRLLRFLGHTVIGDNHLGDWGTQFGILLHGYKTMRNQLAFNDDPVRELARLYIEVRKLFKKDDDEDDGVVVDDPVKDICRKETAKLHAGDPENVALWQQFMPHCLEMLKPIYARLGILPFDHMLGESFYNPMLPGVVEDLLSKKLAQESNGAIVVPNAAGKIPNTPEELKKEDPPALVRKRDGAFTYTTTDLATIQYRVENFQPDVMLYVVDARQALHFRTLFANAKRWGLSQTEFHHLPFGSVLGPDRKPISTRAGGGTELDTLISKAVDQGLQQYKESYEQRKASGHEVPELTPEVEQDIAEAVGIGAVKYADLSSNRTSDYVFDYKKMLATDGNTATYMQYAYARCRSIFRRGKVDEASFRAKPPKVMLEHPAERLLGLQLLRLEEALLVAAGKYEPHHITAYLWDLAKAFSGFYEHCKVIDDANPPEVQASRLLLVNLTGRAIRQALELLGIRTVERM